MKNQNKGSKFHSNFNAKKDKNRNSILKIIFVFFAVIIGNVSSCYSMLNFLSPFSGLQTYSVAPLDKLNQFSLKPTQVRQFSYNSNQYLNHEISELTNLIIYSGTCIKYKKTWVEGNKMKYTPIAKAFSKIVIDRSSKKFSFYFNGNLVFTYTGFLSYMNTDQGGEGFSFSAGLSAHRLIAERYFLVYETGFEYQMEDYRIN